MLGAGASRAVAEQLGIKLDVCLRKAIQHGRLTVPLPTQPEPTLEETPTPERPVATDKSTRSVEDAAAEMGTACTRPDERAPCGLSFYERRANRAPV